MQVPITAVSSETVLDKSNYINKKHANSGAENFQCMLSEAINSETINNNNQDARVKSGIVAANGNRIDNLNSAVLNSYAGMGNIVSKIGEVNESDWIDLKPEHFSMEQFREKIAYANYKRSLLVPENLPRWVTRPEPGKSRSTDMVRPPKFEAANGGVYRIDYTQSGEVRNFIPSFEWRKTADSVSDPEVGKVYNQQTPWGFRTVFIRDGSDRKPEGYHKGAYMADINNCLRAKHLFSNTAANAEAALIQEKGIAGNESLIYNTKAIDARTIWQDRLALFRKTYMDDRLADMENAKDVYENQTKDV